MNITVGAVVRRAAVDCSVRVLRSQFECFIFILNTLNLVNIDGTNMLKNIASYNTVIIFFKRRM